uniref:Actin n=1 Tax=Parascaris univalens TaxID=6257 RepID=A0A915CJ06_PARUN
GSVCQQRTLWWQHNVPWNRRSHAERDHSACTKHDEDQDHRSTREKVLCLDWRIHPRFPFYLPTDVDLETGIRRIRTIYRPSEMLLSKTSSYRYRLRWSKLGI